MTHLAFADDLMIFCRGDVGSVQVVKDCLVEFGNVSGLKANSLKSNVYVAGSKAVETTAMVDMLQFQKGTFPFKYLGIPLAAAKLKVVQYSPLLESISTAIGAWTASSLSFAGKLELIRAVIQGQICYWLSIFNIPSAVVYRIQRLCNTFLWGARVGRVAWQELCFPKSEGGLGVKDLKKTWNKTMLLKELWNRHLNKENLWIQWVHSIYLTDSGLWEWKPKADTPPFLKAVVGVRDLLIEKTGSSVLAIQLLEKCYNGVQLDSCKLYDQLRVKRPVLKWCKMIWDSSIMPKHSFTLWLSLMEKMSTKDKLEHLHICQQCVLCNEILEDIPNLFFQCKFSKEVWQQIRDWLGMSKMLVGVHSSLNWFKRMKLTSGWKGKWRLMTLASRVYWIWKEKKTMNGMVRQSL